MECADFFVVVFVCFVLAECTLKDKDNIICYCCFFWLITSESLLWGCQMAQIQVK